MDKQKIGSMFNRFLADLLITEMVEEEERSEAIQKDLEESEDKPELFEAPEEGWNTYDDFMFSLANQIMEDYGFDRESAMECILAPAAIFIEKKHLPPLPKGQVEEEELAKWVKEAESCSFAENVLSIVDRMVTEAVAEEMASEQPDPTEPDED